MTLKIILAFLLVALPVMKLIQYLVIDKAPERRKRKKKRDVSKMGQALSSGDTRSIRDKLDELSSKD